MRADLRGMLAVAATYVYFLLFAQYGFLRLLESRIETRSILGLVMGAMGLAGIGASLAAGFWLARRPAVQLLRAGYAAAATTAVLALFARGTAAHVAVALLIGASTAAITVALAADLRALVRGPRFASKIGWATGAAYLFCNVPAVFEGDPALQCGLAALVAAAGWAVVPPSGRVPAREPTAPSSFDADARPFGFATVVLSFLALVWLDSAVFSIVQQAPALKALTWQGGSQKWLLGALHLLAAIAAGALLDRGRFRSLLLATFGLFVAGFSLLGATGAAASLGGPLYVAGISTYSVALVVYPSRAGERPGLVPARWRAALLFAIAGWLGSAAGIGMAEDLHRIPHAFVLAAGTLLVAAALLASKPHLARLGGAHRVTGAFALAAVVHYGLAPLVAAPPGESPSTAPSIDRGRAVYVAEGCINCHSQYVRPRTRDVEWWGPYEERDPAARPVLLGNRRQGPDLLNVGLRRNAQWERLHLIDPRSVSPGSRMPSYGHLFAEGDRRGDDLVLYLTSLGAGHGAERYAFTQAWDASTAPRSADHGARLFHELCSPCHGENARGDGPTGRVLARPGMDLLKEGFWLISWGEGAEPESHALARLVKFGAGGSTMPGHETLPAADVADIVAHVRHLRAKDRAALGRAAGAGSGG